VIIDKTIKEAMQCSIYQQSQSSQHHHREKKKEEEKKKKLEKRVNKNMATENH